MAGFAFALILTLVVNIIVAVGKIMWLILFRSFMIWKFRRDINGVNTPRDLHNLLCDYAGWEKRILNAKWVKKLKETYENDEKKIKVSN